MRTNFDFTEFHEIFKHGNGDNHVFSMALFEEYIYFADWKGEGGRGLYRISKYCDENGGTLCVAEKMTQQSSLKPMGVIIVNPLLQPELPENPCERKPCEINEL